MKFRTITLALAMTLIAFSQTFAQLTILSGPRDASYYQFVEDIRNVLAENNGVAIENRSTDGAAVNFQHLLDPESPHKIALMQADYLDYMNAVSRRDNITAINNIKVIVPLATEEIHLVTTKSKYLKNMHMLKESIVNIGDKTQGTYVTATFIKERSEIFWSSRNYHFDEALKELQLGNIDAFFIVGTAPMPKLDLHPDIMVDKLALVPLENFNGWADPYEAISITTSDYKWLEADVPTFGVKTVMIVNEAKLSDDEKDQLRKMVASLRELHPALIGKGHPKWAEVDLNNWDSSRWPLFE